MLLVHIQVWKPLFWIDYFMWMRENQVIYQILFKIWISKSLPKGFRAMPISPGCTLKSPGKLLFVYLFSFSFFFTLSLFLPFFPFSLPFLSHFFLWTFGIWKFLGLGSNQSCNWDLRHSHSSGGSVTYVTACSNTWSLTHWERPGMESTTSQRLCQVLNLQHHNRNSWNAFKMCWCLGLTHRDFS